MSERVKETFGPERRVPQHIVHGMSKGMSKMTCPYCGHLWTLSNGRKAVREAMLKNIQRLPCTKECAQIQMGTTNIVFDLPTKKWVAA